MNQIIKKSKIVYFGTLLGLVLLVAFMEFLLPETLVGLLAGKQPIEFLFQTLMTFLTLGACYIALRLFKMNKVERQLQDNPDCYYQRWFLLRIVLLEVPTVLNILGYYFFLNPSFAYLGLILLLSFPFICPSAGQLASALGQMEKGTGPSVKEPGVSSEEPGMSSNETNQCEK